MRVWGRISEPRPKNYDLRGDGVADVSWSVDSADSYFVCLFFYLGRVIPNTKYYNFLSELRFRPIFLTSQLTGTFVFSLAAFNSLRHRWKNRHLNSSQRSMTSHTCQT